MSVVSQVARPFPMKKIAAAILAAVVFSGNGFAQSRLSLAERVAKLEAQAASNASQQTQMELYQRLQDMQAEVQQLRADNEKLTFELDQLKKRSRDQYLDLDNRVQSLSGGRPNPTSLPNTGSDTPVSEPVPTDPGAGTAGNPTPVAPPAASGNERAEYDVAFAALKRGQYAEASKQFESFNRKYPNGAFADSANYWLGESYYVTQKYQQALKTFQGLLSRFPQSKKVPDSLLKVGYCYYQLGDKTNATTTLKSVMERYPDQPVAKLAEGRLRAMQLDGK
jgi:tol-pal system protein YbgF